MRHFSTLALLGWLALHGPSYAKDSKVDNLSPTSEQKVFSEVKSLATLVMNCGIPIENEYGHTEYHATVNRDGISYSIVYGNQHSSPRKDGFGAHKDGLFISQNAATTGNMTIPKLDHEELPPIVYGFLMEGWPDSPRFDVGTTAHSKYQYETFAHRIGEVPDPSQPYCRSREQHFGIIARSALPLLKILQDNISCPIS